ncbi:MAG: GntR family transcriptional regulator [Clostridiales bacterium]|nr:GntR family transcriptional regulator [Clostridiales bacterium]
MNIIISNSSNKPIYEQISTQIKEKILAGVLKEGDTLPSMRFLAKELRISVITTKRAYEELERDGFIFTMTGRGSFVSQKNTDLIKEEYLRKIEAHMRESLALSAMCDLTIEDLKQMLELLNETTREED